MTRTTQHTPGPWKVQGPYEVEEQGVAILNGEVGIDEYMLAWATNATNRETLETTEADARLIASAPDLLAALQVIHLDRRIYARLLDTDPQAAKQVRRAVDKATGTTASP